MENAGCQFLCFFSQVLLFTTSQRNWLIYFDYQDFQGSERGHFDHPMPSLHWSFGNLYLYSRMEIKTESREALFLFQTIRAGLFMWF